jgi:hypothetical protein
MGGTVKEPPTPTGIISSATTIVGVRAGATARATSPTAVAI